MKQVQGVNIPVPDTRLLLQTKRTVREKDRIESIFLSEKIARENTCG